jgi:hypothetical protein
MDQKTGYGQGWVPLDFESLKMQEQFSMVWSGMAGILFLHGAKNRVWSGMAGILFLQEQKTGNGQGSPPL